MNLQSLLFHAGRLTAVSLITAIAAKSTLFADQSPPADEVQSLREEIARIQAESERQEAERQREIDDLQMQIDRIGAELDRPVERPAPVIGGGQSLIDISAIGTFAAGTSSSREVDELQPGGHDPTRRGFNVQGLELVVAAIVDPYFRAQTNLVFTDGGHGHGSGVELEEAFLETLALPGNLQVRAGQYLTEFGRHNTQHLHTWHFVDAPLVSTRMFGPDGLRNPGARVSWLTPTPFYSELFFGVQNSTGETAYSFRNEEGFSDHYFFRGEEAGSASEDVRSARDLLYTTRYAASFDVTDTQTILGGVSAAFGPNAPPEGGSAGRTEIYGADFYWHWSPLQQENGFPFVAWQSEVMLRRFKMRNPSETFEDYGFYSQVVYGFRRGWTTGLRYDWVRGDMNKAVDGSGERLPFPNRWRLSPNLTWFPSEFSKIRLQYNYDNRDRHSDDHTVWLQFEFSVGPHGAHQF